MLFTAKINMKLKQTFPVASEIISRLELKFLMKSIIGHQAKIRIKYLTEGGRWPQCFLSVMMVTEKGIVFNDDSSKKIKSVRFLDQITQLVIDQPFDGFVSNIAYVVH
jgi:hypothetical protein